MQELRINYTPFMLLLVILAACGAVGPPAETTRQIELGSLAEISGGSFDGRTVTVQAVYYERSDARLLVPSLSLSAPGGPVPLITSPSEAVTLSAAPGVELRRQQGIAFGVIRVQGEVVPTEHGRSIELQSAKPVSPKEVSLSTLLAGGFEGTVVAVEGILLARPGTRLLVSAVGSGGVPESGADQVKVMAAVEDEPLLSRLDGSSQGRVRFGHARLVGLWSGGVLHLLWAEPR